MNNNHTDLENEFIASLKALMTRYGVAITLFDTDYHEGFYFFNSSKDRQGEIFLGLGDIAETTNITTIE